MADEKFLTLKEAAGILRVSRHTVQAWISPSSPNHRPEFAMLARHAGRKTIFIEADLRAWLEQRRGAIYSEKFHEQTTFWRERFLSSRGLFRNFIKAPIHNQIQHKSAFSGGILGLDVEPVIEWLSDGEKAGSVLSFVNKAEGLMISTHLAMWLLRKASRSQSRLQLMKGFVVDSNIFELAPFNQEALVRSTQIDISISEICIFGYSSCTAAGAEAFLTANSALLGLPGLRVSAY